MIVSDEQPTGDTDNKSDAKGPETPPPDESFEGDGLPNIGDADSDVFYLHPDDAETITGSASDDELVPDDMPLYPNQEADPEIASLMFQEYIWIRFPSLFLLPDFQKEQ